MQLNIQSPPPYQTTLYLKENEVEAEIQGSNLPKRFTDKQIKYGVMGGLKHQELFDKIKQVGIEKFFAFPFPKEKPAELWIVEAGRMAGPFIRQGKEELLKTELQHSQQARQDEGNRRKYELQKRCYKEALHHFERALKLQKADKEETRDLEYAIEHIQKKRDLLKWRQKAPLCLPEGEAKDFESILTVYEDARQDEIYECFEKIFDAEENRRPYHYWIWALFHERQRNWLKAIEAYLESSENNGYGISSDFTINCFKKAYALLERAELNDRIDATRLTFEKYLRLLHASSSPHDRPTCFICFNDEDTTVKEWIKNVLEPDLKHVGFQPINGYQDLKPGDDEYKFHEQIRHAHLVIVIFTPTLKSMYEAETQAPKQGVIKQIWIIKQRYNDEEKAGTIFPIIFKSKKEFSIPKGCLEPIFRTEFSGKNFDFHYFIQAFKLFATMDLVA